MRIEDLYWHDLEGVSFPKTHIRYGLKIGDDVQGQLWNILVRISLTNFKVVRVTSTPI
jgi:hypothetical protein